MISLIAPHTTDRQVGRLSQKSRCASVQATCQHEVQRLVRLRAGDRDATEALVSEYGGRMLAVARRMLRSEEDAADAVQDAFLSAFASVHRFQANSQLYTWLHRIVVNACLMKLRSRKRREALSVGSLLPEFDELGNHAHPVAPWPRQASEHIERAETQAMVGTCVDQLPDDHRTILILRDIEELDTDETAATLGISRAAVKTRLHRARQALRTMLEQAAVIEA
jgi:RNA polymerase sigma-70 factor (ECF subfamily)